MSKSGKLFIRKIGSRLVTNNYELKFLRTKANSGVVTYLALKSFEKPQLLNKLKNEYKKRARHN